MRQVTSMQYTLGNEIGRGKFASILQATLQDTPNHENVAAKMNLRELGIGLNNTVQIQHNTAHDFLTANAPPKKILLMRAKLNFLAKEIPHHLNIVNLVAADVSG